MEGAVEQVENLLGIDPRLHRFFAHTQHTNRPIYFVEKICHAEELNEIETRMLGGEIVEGMIVVARRTPTTMRHLFSEEYFFTNYELAKDLVVQEL